MKKKIDFELNIGSTYNIMNRCTIYNYVVSFNCKLFGNNSENMNNLLNSYAQFDQNILVHFKVLNYTSNCRLDD